MRTKILSTLAVLTAFGLAITSASAVDRTTQEGGTVTVDVNNVTAVDLSPNSLAYNTNPGTINSTETANAYNGVEIENVGSENITEIYMNVSQPSDRPFGSGVSGEYDAGNFIQIRPSNEVNGINQDSDYHFVSRKSFNESNTLSYVTAPSDSRYGRFRVANESFFWMVTTADSGGGTNNYCDGQGTSTLRIGETPHSPTQTGSVDFTQTSNYEEYTIDDVTSDNYGLVEEIQLNTYEGSKNMSMLTWCGQSGGSDESTHVIGTRWNPSHRGSGSGEYNTTSDTLEKLMDNPGDDLELQPGEHFTVFTRVAVPNAVANGQVGSGTLTVNVGVTQD